MRAICFTLKTPIIANEGTLNEKREDTFLAYLTYDSKEDAQREVDGINNDKPERLFNRQLAHCDKRFYFVQEQNN